MIQGHYGPAGLLYLLFQDISFVWLMISTQVIDIVFFIFILICNFFCKTNKDTCSVPYVCSEYSSYNVSLMRENKCLKEEIKDRSSHCFSSFLPALLLIGFSMFL